MLLQELLAEIEKIPVIDIHSHLNRDRLSVSHPAEVLLYHMVLYELCAAGGPEDLAAPWHGPEGDPDEAIAHFLPYFERLTNTGFGWGLKTLLRDLYEFDEPIGPASYPRLRAAMDRKLRQPDWGVQVIRRGRIVRTLTSSQKVSDLAPGQPDPGLRFTFEALPFGTLGRQPLRMKEALAKLEAVSNVRIDSFEILRDVSAHWFKEHRLDESRALVAWMNGSPEVADVSPAEAAAMFEKIRAGTPLSPAEYDRLDGSLFRAILGAIRGQCRIFQYVLGCDPVAARGRVRLPVVEGRLDLGAHLGRLAAEFPDLHLDILNGYEPAEPGLCAAAARMPNLSLSSMWWHMFYPSVMEHAWSRRIDMVPGTGLCAFFSDGYCVDWQYARLRLTQRVLAKVLADRVQAGWMAPDEAVAFARWVLFENPRRIFLPEETIEI